MNKTCLFTRPDHDDTTYYLSNWAKEAIAFAQGKGFKVLDLEHNRANRKELESILEKFSPNLVVFNGHGSESTVTGYNNEPLIVVGENERLLRSKIIYSISCRSAKNLGLKSVEEGTVSYSGYNDDFIFFFEPEKISRPLQDKTARLFLEPSNLFIMSLIKGNTVRESKDRLEKSLKENIFSILSGNNPDSSLARFLWWDLKHFVSHGNLDATI